MGDSAVYVGYGPESENSTKVTLVSMEIMDKSICNYIYAPKNVRADERQLVKNELPNNFQDQRKAFKNIIDDYDTVHGLLYKKLEFLCQI